MLFRSKAAPVRVSMMNVKSSDVRAILASTAKPLPGTRPVQTGAGLINPAQAMDYEPVAPAAPVAAQQPKTAAR